MGRLDKLSANYVSEDDFLALEMACKSKYQKIKSIYAIGDNCDIEILYFLEMALSALEYNKIFLNDNINIKLALVESESEFCYCSKVSDTYIIICSDSIVVAFDRISYFIARSTSFRFILHEGYTGYLTTDPGCAPNGLTLEQAVSSQATILTVFIYHLISHELCHIIHGHLDLLEIAGKGKDEKYLWIKRDDYYLTRRVLEYDADCFAACFLTRIIKYGAKFHFFDQFKELKTNIHRISFFCLSILWGAMRGHGEGAKSDSNDSHPKVLARYLNITDIFLANLKIFDLENFYIIDKQVSIFWKLSFELIGQFSDVQDDDKLICSLSQLGDSQMLGEITEMSSRWARLYPLLTELKLTKSALAKPSEEPF